MATPTAEEIEDSQAVDAVPALQTQVHRRRVSPRAGRALEMLGHAIEYLTDEHVHRGGALTAHDPEIEAIQLLMARNRQVYVACPEIPTLRERWRAFLRAHFAERSAESLAPVPRNGRVRDSCKGNGNLGL